MNSGTLLVCEIVLNRYLDVLAEQPECVTPEFRQLIIEAEADVRGMRQAEFLFIRNQVAAVPTEAGRASLVSLAARE